MKLVSIVIPCFNAERFIEDSIQSLVGQSYHPIEIIIVNDGSTDRSGEILGRIKNPLVRVFHQSNLGQCAAANRGYRESTGDLIKFFDADDVMHPEMIARQVEQLEGTTNAVSFGEWTRFYGAHPGQENFSNLTMYRSAPPAEWLVQEWGNARPMMQCGLFLIPRAIIEKRGLWDERLSLINDFEYFSRLLLGANELMYTPQARMFYRSGLSSSLSGRKSRKAIESQFLSLSLGTSHLLAVDDSAAALRACANIFLDFNYSHYPDHADLRTRALARATELGGGDLDPDGPPGFMQLKPIVGWKAARLLQRTAERFGLNAAARSK